MSNVVKLDTDLFPWELVQAISVFVAYYINKLYYESLDTVTTADVLLG